MDMNCPKVHGIIAALIQAAESGYLSAVRLDLRNHEGIIESHMTDTSMMKTHNDPKPMTIEQARELTQAVKLAIGVVNLEQPEVMH